MAVIHRANRKLRKEVVIPFEGEHNFIVPQYVNAAGRAPIVLDEPLVPQAPTSGTYSSSSTSVTSAPVSMPAPIVAVQTTTPVAIASPITSTKPIESTRPIDTQATTTAYNASNYFPVKDYASMSCNAITSYLSELNNVETTSWDGVNAARAQGEYNRLLTSVRNATDTACKVVLPQPTINEEDIVIFPDTSSMDCAALTAEINRLQSVIDLNEVVGESAKSQYRGQITNVQNKFTSKLCGINQGGTASQVNTSTPAVSTPTEVTSTTTVTPPFSPILGGGGGGGLGAEPSATNTEKEITKTVKKDNSWLWILLLVGGIYFLTKKKK
jgi:hypothetical protein